MRQLCFFYSGKINYFVFFSKNIKMTPKKLKYIPFCKFTISGKVACLRAKNVN